MPENTSQNTANQGQAVRQAAQKINSGQNSSVKVGALINVARPDSGDMDIVITHGAKINLQFDTSQGVGVFRLGQDLVFSFGDGQKIYLSGFYDHFSDVLPPPLIIAQGRQIMAEEFLRGFADPDILPSSVPTEPAIDPDEEQSSGNLSYVQGSLIFDGLTEGLDGLGQNWKSLAWDREIGESLLEGSWIGVGEEAPPPPAPPRAGEENLLTPAPPKTGEENIHSGSGDDLVYGGGFGNPAPAGAGNDLVYGAAGNDYLAGGAGADTFVWNYEDLGRVGDPYKDVIRDFSLAGGDKIDLGDILTDHQDLVIGISQDNKGNTILEIGNTVDSGGGQTIFLPDSVVQNIELQGAADLSKDNLSEWVSFDNYSSEQIDVVAAQFLMLA